MITSSCGFHSITLGGVFWTILVLKALGVLWSMEHKILRTPEKNRIYNPAGDLERPSGMPAPTHDSQKPKRGESGYPCPPAKKWEISRLKPDV